MIKKFEEKKFDIGKLKGVSEKNLEEHLKLYSGYIKNTNLILEKIEELENDVEKNSYIINELRRRFSFEYNGIRNHEVYFDCLSSGNKNIDNTSDLYKHIEKDFVSFDKWLNQFKAMATTRGIGWAMLYFDKKEDRLINSWVDEQHIGQLQGCELILGLDMWEHSYVSDYTPSQKKNYVEDFFQNLNWSKIEENLNKSKK